MYFRLTECTQRCCTMNNMGRAMGRKSKKKLAISKNLRRPGCPYAGYRGKPNIPLLPWESLAGILRTPNENGHHYTILAALFPRKRPLCPRRHFFPVSIKGRSQIPLPISPWLFTQGGDWSWHGWQMLRVVALLWKVRSQEVPIKRHNFSLHSQMCFRGNAQPIWVNIDLSFSEEMPSTADPTKQLCLTRNLPAGTKKLNTWQTASKTWLKTNLVENYPVFSHGGSDTLRMWGLHWPINCIPLKGK